MGIVRGGLLSFSHSIPCSLCPGISLPFFCNIPDQPPKHPRTKRRKNPRPIVVPNGQAGRGLSRAQAMRRPGSAPLTIKANGMQKYSGGRRTRPSPCEHHATIFFLSPMSPLPATMRWLRGLPGDLVPSFRPSVRPPTPIRALSRLCHAIAVAIVIAEAIPLFPAFLLACPSPPTPPLFSPLSPMAHSRRCGPPPRPRPHQTNSERTCGMRDAGRACGNRTMALGFKTNEPRQAGLQIHPVVCREKMSRLRVRQIVERRTCAGRARLLPRPKPHLTREAVACTRDLVPALCQGTVGGRATLCPVYKGRGGQAWSGLHLDDGG